MAYLALYRRFRPAGFDGLVGQDHIVRTLKNQIKTDRIGHAYLFCGARGTGKTSAAKIFARAINCSSPVDGSPCGKCPSCVALSDSSNLDILEMDAASNNKVENVREIREKIQYPPVSGKYKVYIIDEVHMLTTEAFNALLKTLEEPPAHAVFILATTEVHKLPSTILSRCMRFDFRLIPTRRIADLIGRIYDEIGKEYDDEAVVAIARAGNGSIRDALSIADICVSYREGRLVYSDVLDVLGATDSEKITSLISAMFASKTGEMLEAVEELSDSGKSIGVLCRDIITRLREIIVCKTCKGAKNILEIPEEMFGRLKAVGDTVDEHRLLRAVEIFSEAEATLRYSTTPRIVLESACIKASEPSQDYNIDALLSRIDKLEKMLNDGAIKPVAAQGTDLKSIGDAPSVKREAPVTEAQGIKGSENVDKRLIADDFDVPEPPPDEFFGDGQVSFSPAEKQVKREEPVRAEEKKPVREETVGSEEKIPVREERTASPASAPAPSGMSAARVWGTVVRKLRSDGNVVLWVACQEMRASFRGNTLVIYAPDDGSYSAITKESNLSILAGTVKAVGDYDIEVVRQGAKEEDGTEKDIESVKKTFGENIVRIK